MIIGVWSIGVIPERNAFISVGGLEKLRFCISTIVEVLFCLDSCSYLKYSHKQRTHFRCVSLLQPSPLPHSPTFTRLSLSTSTSTSSNPCLPPRRSTTIQSPPGMLIPGLKSTSGVLIPMGASLNSPFPETSRTVLLGPCDLSTDTFSRGFDLED